MKGHGQQTAAPGLSPKSSHRIAESLWYGLVPALTSKSSIRPQEHADLQDFVG